MLRKIKGETETALRQLINGLQDFEAAERFCEAASSRREKFSLLGSVFNICVERPGEMPRNMTNFAARCDANFHGFSLQSFGKRGPHMSGCL